MGATPSIKITTISFAACWSELCDGRTRGDSKMVRALRFISPRRGRAYARRLHSAGVREAGKYAQRTIVIAGMLGVPTSKEDLAR